MLRILAVVFLLSVPMMICAQPTDSERAADSLVREHDELFEDIPDTLKPVFENESKPRLGRLPARRLPEYSPIMWNQDLLRLRDRYPVFLSYNRADGLYLGFGADAPARTFLAHRTQAHLGFGYSFGSHFWHVAAGLKRDIFAQSAPLRISVEGHIITDTQDAWKMGGVENTVFALLAGIDARNYFKRMGFSIGLQKFLTQRVAIKGEFRRDTYRNLKREADWSLFGPSQPFSEVPTIREGAFSSVVVNLLADYITFRDWSQPQVGLEAQAEFGLGNASFEQYVADARMKLTVLSGRLWVAFHARAASATGDAPIQKLFTLGGFGSLPGFPQNAFGGNRMIVIQSDVLFTPTRDGALSGLRFILSNDAGAVATTATTSQVLGGFPGTSDLLYSTGIYVGNPTATIRIGAAWRTDVYAPPTFVMRLAQRF